MVNRWDPTLGTPRGDKYYNQYRPQCEVCPRDNGKVVESLQGRACTAFQLLSTSLPCFVFAKSEDFGKSVRMQSPMHSLIAYATSATFSRAN